MKKTPSRNPINAQFGKYRLLGLLATGGMAEIYLASFTSLAGFRKLVVIKQILPHLAREERFVKMFLDEARIAATLSHSNVVQIFDVGQIQNKYYIAMEYLAGESIATLIRTVRNRKILLPFELSAGIILQAAEGLHYAHTAVSDDGKPMQIIHRDVSPQNIFILFEGAVKIVDFGIAKPALSESHTATGVLKGKLSYMSPEQIQGKVIDARTDVYSLGVVLWECLTMRRLYKVESELELLKTIIEKDAPSPRSVIPEIPEPLAEIALKALARDSEKRFQSALELRTALAAYLKSVSAEADTIAIKAFMHTLFAEQIQKNLSLLETSQAASQEGEELLFEDISEFLADTEYSVPFSPISYPPVENLDANATSEVRVPYTFVNSKTWGILLCLVGIIVFAGVGLWVWLVKVPGPNPGTPSGEISLKNNPTTIEIPNPVTNPVVKQTEENILGANPDSRMADAQAKEPIAIATTKSLKKKRPTGSTLATKTKKSIKELKTKNFFEAEGILDIACLPWCEIRIDGKLLGKTSPLINYQIPVGRHHVEVSNPPSGAKDAKDIEIRADEKTKLKFRLLP